MSDGDNGTQPPKPQRDFLVIYEEYDDGSLPTDDVLVLDVETPKFDKLGEIDVEQQLDLDLSNTASRVGTAGLAITTLGSLLGFGLVAYFMTVYPGSYYTGSGIDAGLVRTLLTLGLLTLLLLLTGTVLTHYGRRIKARANLSAVRLVEKSAHPTPRFD